jgi:serralysin
MDNQEQWCFAWFAQAQASAGQDRAALVTAAKWQSNDKITVSFLDGDPQVCEKVKAVAQTWTGQEMANVRLVFQKNTDSMIRISFRQPGSWSMIGTTCLRNKDLKRPTMNFGWLKPDSTQGVLERVVLHEFGHALGMIHEHQNPENNIDWNRDAVIKDLSGGENKWSLEQIDQNMFKAYSKTETNSSGFDKDSIMLYPIPKSWTRNGFSVGLNSQLSPDDRAFIRKQYP